VVVRTKGPGPNCLDSSPDSVAAVQLASSPDLLLSRFLLLCNGGNNGTCSLGCMC
jgi:hypothetical protein